MAAHLRTQIRDAAVLVLGGLATTGARVFPSRLHPLNEAELPALRVYTAEESVALSAPGGAASLLERELALRVDVVVQAADGFDDDADQATKEVEQAMAADPSLGGLVKHCFLTRIDPQPSVEGDRPTIVQTLTFLALYYAAANAPDQSR